MAQGLSVGVQDAVNLGWKLAAVLRGRASEDLLDTYHGERHPIGRQLARNARAAIELRLTGQEMAPLRAVLGELMTHKDAAAHLAGVLSGLGIRYDMGPGEHPLLGRRMPPHHELTRPDGTSARVADLLHTARGVLICTAGAEGAGKAAQLAEDWADRIDILTATWSDHPDAPEAALIRPDGYVAWTDPGSDSDLTDALAHWFGTPRTTTAAVAARPL